MDDSPPGCIFSLYESVRRALDDRARPLGEVAGGGPAGGDGGFPTDPGHEFGETPEGYRQAFLAGGRPPWPGPRGSDLAATWTALRRTQPSGRTDPGPPVGHRPMASNSGARVAGASAWQGSRNWSGALITANGEERFSAACGRWKVPDARDNAALPPPIPGPRDEDPLSRRVSVWVGLDGHRRMAASLPQIGTTTSECFQDGKRWIETYAWAQWWVRGEPYPEVRFADFVVSPGDEVTCWIALHAPDRAVLCIRNETTGQEDGTLWRSGLVANDFLAEVAHVNAAPVTGQAAVWVVERPTVAGRDDLYPLPDFGEVVFQDCIAGVRLPEQPFHEVADLRGLGGRRVIRMLDRRVGPARSVCVSSPVAGSARGTGLTVRYCD
ncbi:G1 family glutamic endopeptidase [Roseomonas sp. CCTCC AB2023176]|uniref:G1 family glutamic endopeptidase n=1 Tax=Roseomonas sp. CCTCC AB2023176 TaxID=3342640 RepID=UPI0035DC3D17